MFNIALFEPKIPANTGNIIRLCANTGCSLHLIHPLGFFLNDKHLQRAGLDYHDLTIVNEHENFRAFTTNIPTKKIFAIETCGEKSYHETAFKPGDTLLFGAETYGLSEEVLKQLPKENIIRIPMQPNNRSINLSNSVAIVLYEAWRQNSFGVNCGRVENPPQHD